MAMNTDREDLFKLYFQMGLNNAEIMYCLASNHGIIISLRTLKRIAKKCGCYRRKIFSDILDVAVFILSNCEGSGQGHGYRWMHQKCIQNGLVVPQKTVRLLMSIVDPKGVEQRKQRRLKRRIYHSTGPNALWHIDGYDKIKPFGICIHGCIDGFSRKIVWLEAWHTNNDPRVIGGYFIDAVRNNDGCPERVRADAGTENTYVKQLQIFLRSGHIDRFSGQRSYLQGTSTANQKIEFFWGILRKEAVNFWIELFKQLQNDGYYTGDFLDRNLMQFCFLNLIQDDLDKTAEVWNCHRIRRTARTDLPNGRPILMYAVPDLFGVNDRIKEVNPNYIDLCDAECVKKTNVPCDEEMYRLFEIILEEMRLTLPSDPYDMCDLYINLRQNIRDQIKNNVFRFYVMYKKVDVN